VPSTATVVRREPSGLKLTPYTTELYPRSRSNVGDPVQLLLRPLFAAARLLLLAQRDAEFACTGSPARNRARSAAVA